MEQGSVHNPQVTVERSWERLMSEVNQYDDGLVKNWKEDIDTLLVFADPADTVVALLTQISKQLSNATTLETPQLKFEPSSSSIRINTLWFLSLVLSLTSGLFGLLCKQWLREHRRDTPAHSQAETLALRELRNASFREWAVSSFLAMLPILLEVALLLFLAGILELLWTLHLTPFIVISIAVGFSVGLYVMTTILPTISMFSLTVLPSYASDKFNDNIRAFHNICPYKSPQAWWFFWFCSKIIRHSSLVQSLFAKRNRHVVRMRDWSRFDLHLIRRPYQAEHTSWRMPVDP
ncbi:hypothetical protein Moror_16995 [Moniliophthora roreri MCA 2997]|uniref:DUF6535 domain-containing protein n=1 Tax=Moniliophthora roreri (strain MCA 2997) TaxID=1381753 RepID=V2WVH4_MONRO|nr:hypothetical protein Moror_16995 [Moniliophthora roreri MCA 2997]